MIDISTMLNNLEYKSRSADIAGNEAANINSREDLKQVDLKKYKKIIARLESDLKKKLASVYRFRGAKLKAAQDILQRKLIYEAAQETKRSAPCYAGKLNLVLTETGDLYPCEDFSEQMKFGNIRESQYDLQHLLKADRGRNILGRITCVSG